MKIDLYIVSYIIGGTELTTELFFDEDSALNRFDMLKSSFDFSDYTETWSTTRSNITGIKNMYNPNGDFLVVERK